MKLVLLRAGLLLLLASAVLAVEDDRREIFSIPNMQKLRELDDRELGSLIKTAKGAWMTEYSPKQECRVIDSPCSGEVLTKLWDSATSSQRSFLAMALAKDAYPKPENLGVTGDGPEYECKLSAKWRSLGAEQVKFINTELTNLVLLKAGSNVFINYRGTWTDAQDNNNRHEWAKVPGPLGGQVHRGWLRSVKESWDLLTRTLAADFGCSGQCKVHFSGHSRGGALATLAATQLPEELGTVGSVVTFGSVRPGSKEFQDVYNLKLGALTQNWWNRQDWVPRQPFTNRQSPRLRLTESVTCPVTTTTQSCYELTGTNKKGQVKTISMCSKSSSNLEGDKAHHERQYLLNILACAMPLNMSPECVGALL